MNHVRSLVPTGTDLIDRCLADADFLGELTDDSDLAALAHDTLQRAYDDWVFDHDFGTNLLAIRMALPRSLREHVISALVTAALAELDRREAERAYTTEDIEMMYGDWCYHNREDGS